MEKKTSNKTTFMWKLIEKLFSAISDLLTLLHFRKTSFAYLAKTELPATITQSRIGHQNPRKIWIPAHGQPVTDENSKAFSKALCFFNYRFDVSTFVFIRATADHVMSPFVLVLWNDYSDFPILVRKLNIDGILRLFPVIGFFFVISTT